MEMFFEMFAVILVLGAVIFLSYIVTRYIGEKAKNAMRGKYISVVETLSLGMDKRIHLVKVGEQYILIASSGKNIQFLTEIDLSDYEDQKDSEETTAFSFKSIFEKYAQSLVEKKNQPSGNEADAEYAEDKSVFRNNLTRIKALTERVTRQDINDGDEKSQ